jgi:cytoskeletal protein CcmA (bactofilin family)
MRRRLGAFLDEGSEIDGKYRCTGTVVLEGKLTGEIVASDTLVVGQRAVVHATIEAASVVVHGEVVGRVTASERVELTATARVAGDIGAPVIVMAAGAVHEGQSRMVKPEAADASPPLLLAKA